MKIALLTTDNREPFKDYNNSVPWFGTAPEALLQGFAQLPEVEVHVIGCIRQPVRSPEKLAPNIFFHSVVVPKMGWMRTGYQGCIRATRKKLREIQPDIVHGQGTERDCALAAVFSGFPNVLTIHGNMKAIAEIYGARFGSFHWLAAKLETGALKRTAGVLCNSAYTASLVSPRTKKIWRVPNALRAEFFEGVPANNSGRPVLLNVGAVEPRKRQLELLQVAHQLHQLGLKFELQFASGKIPKSPYGARFSQALAAGREAGFARHLGHLSGEGLVTAMDAAGALVHFPTEEAFGLVVGEALSRNLKFFGAATGGVVEIAEGVKDAELFSAENFSGLETGIAGWLRAGCPRSQDAAVVMRARYHPLMITQKHVEIYREILRPR